MGGICFVTNEIHPTKPGGAAFLIYNLAQTLLAEGQRVIFLLDLSEEEFARFDTVDRLELPNNANCRAYRAGALCANAPFRREDFLSRYLWKTACLDFAARQVERLEQPDLIEFVDYCGAAYCALNAKAAGLGYQDARLAARMHGPISLIDRAAPVRPLGFERLMIYALEEHAFRFAESVLYATPSLLKEDSGLDARDWLGELVSSPPMLTARGMESLPRRAAVDPSANIILFYGRLYAQKGVDLFVEAALRLLEEDPRGGENFYLVGPDSQEPPDPAFSSYRRFLERKIPRELRRRFTFTGFLTHAQLAELLPRVRFAVLPSFYETYCYAAQELRMAGIPLIVSSIPAFEDTFNRDEDALFFDGSLGGLVEKMRGLNDDFALRERLGCPFTQKLMGEVSFYREIPRRSWMTAPPASPAPELLIGVIADEADPGGMQKTLDSLRNLPAGGHALLILKKAGADRPQAAARFLGGEYTLCGADGNPIPAGRARAKDALLLLRAGDEVAPEWIPLALGVLARQPRIAFVGCWKRVRAGGKTWLQTQPLDALSELIPFELQSVLSRCVMRSRAGLPLEDLFDRRAGALGEADYLWRLEDEGGLGLCVPEALMQVEQEDVGADLAGALSFIVLKRGGQPKRAARLARYLTLLTNGYPAPRLPLQEAWLRKGGLSARGKAAKRLPVFPVPGLAARAAQKLAQSGELGRRIVAALRRGRAKWNKRRWWLRKPR